MFRRKTLLGKMIWKVIIIDDFDSFVDDYCSPELLGIPTLYRQEQWWRRSWVGDSTCNEGSTWTLWKENLSGKPIQLDAVKIKRNSLREALQPNIEGVLGGEVEHPSEVDVVHLSLVWVAHHRRLLVGNTSILIIVTFRLELLAFVISIINLISPSRKFIIVGNATITIFTICIFTINTQHHFYFWLESSQWED